MVSVVEYGDHIGTLKNLFLDHHQAKVFAEKLISSSYNRYECIGPDQWYCREKSEYIEIYGDK